MKSFEFRLYSGFLLMIMGIIVSLTTSHSLLSEVSILVSIAIGMTIFYKVSTSINN